MKRIFLTLLTLVLVSLACTVPAPNSLGDTKNLPNATPNALGTPTNAPDVRVVIADTLNVRSCAGTWCPAVDWLTKGESVLVERETATKWCEIGTDRFVACWYLEK